jgi:hypothetical protein
MFQSSTALVPVSESSRFLPLPAANGITQSTAVTYDLSLGKPTQLTEQYAGSASGTIAVSFAHYGNNGNDLLDRLSSVTRGTGSTSPTAAAPTQTVYGYNDQPGALEVDTCQDLNTYQETTNSGTSCSGGVKTARLFDGFGQPVEARTYEGATGYISTQTCVRYSGLAPLRYSELAPPCVDSRHGPAAFNAGASGSFDHAYCIFLA